jgi:hypothetical protein
MSTRRRVNRNAVCSWLLIVLAFRSLTASAWQARTGIPTLRYDAPEGFTVGNGEEAETWISDHLDGVIHVYQFRPFHGDFQDEFRRALFRDRIYPPYREDRLLAQPQFKALPVRGAEAALAASFKNFNGGASREHLRVAVLSSGFVALVDISANSPQAFQRNQPSVVRLLNSLQVVDGNASAPRRVAPPTARP